MTDQPSCGYPNCPTGQNTKLQDERHEEVKKSLEMIQSNQRDMIAVVERVAVLLADVKNIEVTMTEVKKNVNDLFSRVRGVELSLEGIKDIKEVRKSDFAWAWDAAKLFIAATAGAFSAKYIK